MEVISMVLEIKALVKDRIICVWDTKLEILHFTYDLAKNHIIKDISEFDKFTFIFGKIIKYVGCLIKKPVYFSLRREYPPLSLKTLQLYIDTNRLDISKPIDLISLINTGLYNINVHWKHAGVHLTDEVMSCEFKI